MNGICRSPAKRGRRPFPHLLQVLTIAFVVSISFKGLPQGLRSNGNGTGYADVGMWYETLYDARMWALGSFPDRSIKYLPLCPKPIIYTGSWSYDVSGAGCYKSDLHTSKTAGDSVQYTFTGTGIRVYGVADFGGIGGLSLTISIDGVEVPFTQPVNPVDRILYENTDLTSTTHTLKLKNNGGAALSIDAFEYTYSWIDIDDIDNCYRSDSDLPSGAQPTVIQFCDSPSASCPLDNCSPSSNWLQQQRVNRFDPDHSWTNYTGYWHESYTSSSTAGATAKCWFKGKAIKIIGDTTTAAATATVVVDGDPNQTYQAVIQTQSAQHQQTLCYIPTLVPTTGDYHTVALTITSSGAPVVIDEFKYLPDTEVWTRANDNDADGYHQYDSGDLDIIDYHLGKLAAAKVDFVLVDISNGGLGGTRDLLTYYEDDTNSPPFFIVNLQRICQRIQVWNATHSWKIKYAIATGADADHNPQAAANDVYSNYYQTYGPDNYFQIEDGGVLKPLLVLHGGTFTLSDSRFALRQSGATVPGGVVAGWYGWWAPPGGPLHTAEETLIEPGYNNHSGWAVSRENGAYFQTGWTTILGGWSGHYSTPKIVLIPSFNEYIEDNAVWDASTTYLDQELITLPPTLSLIPRDERWIDPNGQANASFYWDTTVNNVNLLRDGLVALWKAENDASDAVGYQNGVLEGNGGFAPGKVGQAFSLDGVNSDVRVADSPELHMSSGITVEAWINPTQNGAWQNVITKWDGTYQCPEQKSFAFGLDPDNHIYVGISRDGTDAGALSVSSVSVVPINGWTHVAGTYNGTTLTIYVNGAWENSVSFGNAGDIFVGTAGTHDISIGAVVGGFGPGGMVSPFQGLIDEAVIYNRALNDCEILASYEAGNHGAVAWWPAEQTTHDMIGLNNGTLEGGAGFAAGKVGHAFSFNGANQDVRIPDSPGLHLTSGMTLAAWINPEITYAWQNVITKWDGTPQSPEQKSFAFGLDPDNHIYVGISRDGTDAGALSVSSVSAVPINGWTHVAGTYNGTTLTIYVNGAWQNSASFGNARDIFVGTAGTHDISIGAVVGGFGPGGMISPFQGLIDEPAIYARPLSDAEILEIYNAGAPNTCPLP